MSLHLTLASITALALLIYLAVVLVRPEKF